MAEQPTLDELYALALQAVPEPGMHRAEAERMLEAARTFFEGPAMFLAQSTSRMARELLRNDQLHTFHQTVSDYDFQARLLAVLQDA